ncbi:hypothetical protein B296_00019706, partial [Ensete ventricosum]
GSEESGGHDLDTAVIEGSLVMIRERYNIPTEYGLHVPQPGQRPYSLDASSMCISVYALEADLRFPLHPLIEEFSRAPSSNKGWKSRYLYVSSLVLGFRLDWSAHPIDNAPPYLSEKETVMVSRMKGILSSSRAMKEMVELWLGEAGLSRPLGVLNILLYFSLSNCLLTCRSECRPDGSRGASRDAQSDKRQGPSDPTHRPRGRRVSCEGSSEGFVEEASHLPT